MKIFNDAMLDRPDKQAVGGAAAYGLFSYVLIPFLLYWMSFGFNGDPQFRAGGQLVHHGINFLTMLWLFREYLQDSFLNVEMKTGEVVYTVVVSTIIILAVFVSLWTLASMLNVSFVIDMVLSALPIGEVDTLMFSTDVIYVYPLLGSLVMILVTPVTTSCCYYAMSFAPVCCKKPWLAYVVVALILAIPRMINAFLFWPAEQELAIYLGQLPIHLVACRAYQKCDTVWAPIFCLMAANLIACVFFALPSLLTGWLGQ